MRLRVPEALGALREREFRLLLVGQTVSLLGDGMVGVALSFAILDLTGSVSDLGFVFAARTIPLVVFLLVGGVFADRLPRRAVMLTSDAIRLVTQGVIAALLISGHARIWEFVVAQAFYGTATAFFNPASTGLIPTVVSAARLQQANALRGVAMATGRVAGPALAGVLVATSSPGWALAVDSASFGASAYFLARLRPEWQQEAFSPGSRAGSPTPSGRRRSSGKFRRGRCHGSAPTTGSCPSRWLRSGKCSSGPSPPASASTPRSGAPPRSSSSVRPRYSRSVRSVN